MCKGQSIKINQKKNNSWGRKYFLKSLSVEKDDSSGPTPSLPGLVKRLSQRRPEILIRYPACSFPTPSRSEGKGAADWGFSIVLETLDKISYPF